MKHDKILLDHGSGGKISNSMISELILPAFNNPILAKLNDGATLTVNNSRIAFSTDSYVVDPIFFPGGSIGDLAVNGTVNDISMCGAMPLYLSAGLIIEEGFPVEDLKKILKDMGLAAKKAGVQIVTGDTKVVPRKACDKIFINTSGIGLIPENINVSGTNAMPGDKIIISGTMADHGITILTQREEMAFDTTLSSDSAPLNYMVKKILSVCPNTHVLRDPTRGGVGTTLNEIAQQSKVGIKIYEKMLPVKNEVRGICELLGFDPLYVANEGKLLVIVADNQADAVLKAVQSDEFGKDAAIIGEVVEGLPSSSLDDSASNLTGRVFMETVIGGQRIVDMLTGEQLPRIC